MAQSIRVELGDRSYEVRVGRGVLEDVGSFVAAAAPTHRAVVISDAAVATLYGPRTAASLTRAGIDATLLPFAAGEHRKNLVTCSEIFDGLFRLDPAVDRRTVVVALGGGVTGDLAGFVAATTMRGLRWVQCPTTLLADVDASVGGKTGVDHATGKNLIGAFHQPSGVLIDVELLASLPEGEFCGGLSECVKHGIIRDASLLDFIEGHVREILSRDPQVMEAFVARNVAIKAAVVSGDERESAEREHLNFGHTVAHAIEAALGYENISHGAAVSLGIVAECELAADRGLLERGAASRVRSILRDLHLPVTLEGLDPEAIWRSMQYDKKNRGGRVRMILPVALGEVATFDDITPDCVRTAVGALAE